MPSPLALRWSTVGLILVTSGGVLAAMYWHSLRRQEQWQQLPPAPADLRWQGTPRTDETAGDLEAWVADADDLAGLTDLERLPDDVALPAGLTPRAIVQRQLPGQTQIQADFQAGGDVQQWLDSISVSLAGSGWQVAVPATQAAPAASVTLFKEQDVLTVRLQQVGQEVSINLVLQRLEH